MRPVPDGRKKKMTADRQPIAGNKDASNVDFVVNSAQTVTTTDQGAISASVMAWVNASLPAGAYVRQTTFSAVPFSLCCGGTIPFAYIRVTAAYDICP